jgi:YceI-like domain
MGCRMTLRNVALDRSSEGLSLVVRSRVRAAVLMLPGLLLAACVGVKQAPPAAPPGLPSQCVAPASHGTERVFQLDRSNSTLRILTYRGGKLAHLGHNHLIASRDLWGYGVLAKTLDASHFALCVPVQTLIVDDPQLRAAAGEAFAEEVTDSAATGTHRNMLSERQLDGERYPYIVVLGRIVGGEAPQISMDIELHVRDKVYTVATTATFEQSARNVVVSGSVQVKQTDLGIQPYTALFGALTVRDEIDIQFDVRATTATR